jgi:small GTP-binding protein
MDLRDYEQDKFTIADILRSAAALARADDRAWETRLRDLYARLAEDRFNVVVVGRFSQGKSSLMNAILRTDRLPTGLVPLTSVITTVSYGTKEQVVLNFDQRILTQEIPIEALPQFITQEGNPGNVRRIKTANVQLRADILRQGFYFVDTPGLGSAIAENTLTTESFLPEGDAFLLVTSYESPLSEDELRFFRLAETSHRRVFVVINKHDLLDPEGRAQIVNFVRQQLQPFVREDAPRIFSVSAREGLEAKRSNDRLRLAASGIAELEEALTSFLLAEKRAEFLLRLCDRVANLIHDLPDPTAAARSLDRLRDLAQVIGGARIDVGTAPGHSHGLPTLSQFRPCEICEHVHDVLWQFLCRFQYDVIVNPDDRLHFGDAGGFCGIHTWQYQAIASPYGLCCGLPPLLDRVAAVLRGAHSGEIDIALVPDPVSRDHCAACMVQGKAEAEALSALAEQFARDREESMRSLSALCLPHFDKLIVIVKDVSLIRDITVHQATLLEHLSEDMRRYALRHNASRHILDSQEEMTAADRAVQLLAGYRNLALAK